MEIEKKFLIKSIPTSLESLSYAQIEQAYISVSPVIRIRKKNDHYYLTCKSGGMMAREEFEIEIAPEEYNRLKEKTEGNVITKKRYYIPLENQLQVELDCFEGCLSGLVMAEVEFPTIEAANSFTPPAWFDLEVTTDPRFHNSCLSRAKDVSHLPISRNM